MNAFGKRVVFTIALLGVATLAASAGVLLWQRLNPPPQISAVAPPPATAPVAAAAVGDPRPDLSLRDVSGRYRSLNEWDGKLLVVNFWATWCPPCIEEIPLLNALHEKYQDQGLAVLGIALDDVERVRDFLDVNNVSYESLHGEKDAIDASKAFGNAYGGLPFTAVVGRNGQIVMLHQGIVTEAQMEEVIASNL